jgi:hypothetical protein
MDEDMKHERGHRDMDEDMETWARTWRHGRGHGDIETDMVTWTRT